MGKNARDLFKFYSYSVYAVKNYVLTDDVGCAVKRHFLLEFICLLQQQATGSDYASSDPNWI